MRGGFVLRAVCLGASLVAPAQAVQDDEPLERYGEALLRNPRPGPTFDRYYQLVLDSGSIDSVVQSWEEQVRAGGQGLEVRLILALLYDRTGQSEAAVQLLADIDASDPWAPVAAVHRVQLFESLHRIAEAVDAGAIALEMDLHERDRTELTKRYGRLCFQNGDSERGLRALEDLLARSSDDAHLAEEVAEVLTDEGQWDAALRAWDRASYLASDDPFLQYRAGLARGRIHAKRDASDLAIQEFDEQLSEVSSDSWQARELRSEIRSIYLQTKNWDGWLAYLRDVLSRDSGDWTTADQLARTLARLGREDEAIDLFRDMLRQYPGHKELRMSLVERLADLRRYDQAIEECETLLRVHADYAEGYRVHGHLELRSVTAVSSEGEKAEAVGRAVAAWTSMAGIEPEVARGAVGAAGECLAGYRRMRWAERGPASPAAVSLIDAAESFYRDAIDREPARTAAYEAYGELLHQLQRREEAEAMWRQLTRPPHVEPESFERCAEIAKRWGYAELALEAAAGAAERRPNDFRTHARLADLQISAGAFEEARATLEQLQSFAEDSLQLEGVIELRLALAVGQEAIAEEVERLKEALQRGDGTPFDQWLQAVLHTHLGDYDNALSFFRAAAQLDPENEHVAVAYADCLELANRVDRAAEEYTQLAERFPRSATRHLERVVRLEMSAQRYGHAVEIVERLLAESPDHVDYHLWSAEIAALQDREADRIQALRRGILAVPDSPALRITLAQLLQEAGESREAFDHYWACFQYAHDLEDMRAATTALAECATQLGTLDELVTRVRDLIRVRDDARRERICLAELLYSRSEHEEAQGELASLIEARPSDVEVLETLVQFASQSETWDEAIHYQQQLYEIEPLPERLERLAVLYSDGGRYEESEVAFVQLFRESGSSDRIVSEIDAVAAVDITRALRLANAGLRVHPDEWTLLFRSGLLAGAGGEHDLAVERLVDLLARSKAPTPSAGFPSIEVPKPPPPFLTHREQRWYSHGTWSFYMDHAVVEASPGSLSMSHRQPTEEERGRKIGDHWVSHVPLWQTKSQAGGAGAWPQIAPVVDLLGYRTVYDSVARFRPDGNQPNGSAWTQLVGKADSVESARSIAVVVALHLLPDAQRVQIASAELEGLENGELFELALALTAMEELGEARIYAEELGRRDPDSALSHFLRLYAIEAGLASEDFELDIGEEIQALESLEWFGEQAPHLAGLLIYDTAARLILADQEDFATELMEEFAPTLEELTDLLRLTELAFLVEAPDLQDMLIGRLTEGRELEQLPLDLRDTLFNRILALGPKGDLDLAFDLLRLRFAKDPIDHRMRSLEDVGADGLLGVYEGGGNYAIESYTFPRSIAALTVDTLHCLRQFYRAMQSAGREDEVWDFVMSRQDSSPAHVRVAARMAECALLWWDHEPDEATRLLEELAADEAEDASIQTALAFAYSEQLRTGALIDHLVAQGVWGEAEPEEEPSGGVFSQIFASERPTGRRSQPNRGAMQQVANYLHLEGVIGDAPAALPWFLISLEPGHPRGDLSKFFPKTKEDLQSAEDAKEVLWWNSQSERDSMLLVMGLFGDYDEVRDAYVNVRLKDLITAAKEKGVLDQVIENADYWLDEKPDDSDYIALRAALAFSDGEEDYGGELLDEWWGLQTGELTVINRTARWLWEMAVTSPDAQEVSYDLAAEIIAAGQPDDPGDAAEYDWLLGAWAIYASQNGTESLDAFVGRVLGSVHRAEVRTSAEHVQKFCDEATNILSRVPGPHHSAVVLAFAHGISDHPLARMEPEAAKRSVRGFIGDRAANLSSAQKEQVAAVYHRLLFPHGKDRLPLLRDWRIESVESDRFEWMNTALNEAKAAGCLDDWVERWRGHPDAHAPDMLIVLREAARVRGSPADARHWDELLLGQIEWSYDFRTGLERMEEGRFGSAQKLLDRALLGATDDRTRARVCLELSACLEAFGDPRLAQRYLFDAAGHDALVTPLESLWEVVLTPLWDYEWDRLRTPLMTRLRVDAEDAEARALLGAIHHQTGDFEAAVRELSLARSSRGGTPSPRDSLLLSICQWHEGQREEARESYQVARRILGDESPPGLDGKLLAMWTELQNE